MTGMGARRRGDEGDQGFTLLELMVVILIIAILMAIAIPTFLGTKARAQDRAAQTDLRNAMANARTFSVEHQGYYNNDSDPPVPITPADMGDVEGALYFVGPDAADQDTVGVIVDSETVVDPPGRWVIFVTESGSGRFYCVYSDDQTEVYYGQGASEDDVDEPHECNDREW